MLGANILCRACPEIYRCAALDVDAPVCFRLDVLQLRDGCVTYQTTSHVHTLGSLCHPRLNLDALYKQIRPLPLMSFSSSAGVAHC
jgi:hypothetical protein